MSGCIFAGGAGFLYNPHSTQPNRAKRKETETMTPFHMILPLADLGIKFKSPPPYNLKALAARCDEKNLLSVDYLDADSLGKATAIYQQNPPTDGQKQLAAKLKTRLCDYFSQGREFGGFGGLSLSYSVLAARMQDCKVKIPLDECVKVLEKVCAPLVDYGKPCSYGDIAEKVEWGNEAAVRQAVKEAYPDAKSPLAKAVGVVCGNNPFGIVVPVFRVILARFRLGDFHKGHDDTGENTKRDKKAWREVKCWLLQNEGCKVDGANYNSQVIPRHG